MTAAGDRYHFDLAMGARNHALCGHWRDELVRLENDYKDLEAMCCPPEASWLKEKVWQPAPAAAADLPRVEHTPPTGVRPGTPLRLVVRVLDPAGVASVTLRYRHVTQFEDYATLTLAPTGAPDDDGDDEDDADEPDEYAATVPAAFLVPEWDFMYFVEVTNRAGRGTQWPDLAKEAPYVILRLAR